MRIHTYVYLYIPHPAYVLYTCIYIYLTQLMFSLLIVSYFQTQQCITRNVRFPEARSQFRGYSTQNVVSQPWSCK